MTSLVRRHRRHPSVASSAGATTASKEQTKSTLEQHIKQKDDDLSKLRAQLKTAQSNTSSQGTQLMLMYVVLFGLLAFQGVLLYWKY